MEFRRQIDAGPVCKFPGAPGVKNVPAVKIQIRVPGRDYSSTPQPEQLVRLQDLLAMFLG